MLAYKLVSRYTFIIIFINYFYLERERESEKETQRERIDGVLITALTTCFKG